MWGWQQVCARFRIGKTIVRVRAEAVVSPHSLCACLCLWVYLYNQWNDFLLTTASSGTANHDFDNLHHKGGSKTPPLLAPWSRSCFQPSNSEKFPGWNTWSPDWHGQTTQHVSVEPARWFPRQRPHVMNKPVTSLYTRVFPGLGSASRFSSQIFSTCVFFRDSGGQASIIPIPKFVSHLTFNGNIARV